MRNRIRLLVIALLAVLSLAACGNEGSGTATVNMKQLQQAMLAAAPSLSETASTVRLSKPHLMISSLPRTLVPTKKPSGAARLPRRVFSVSPVAATGSGRKKSQTFPPPPDAGSGIPPGHRVQDGRRVLVADGLNAADGVPPAFCAAAQGCGWPNTGQRALPLPPPTYAAAGKMIPPPAPASAALG